MKILLTGHTGQLGHVLAQDLLPLGEVVCPSRAGLDLSQPEQIRDVLRATRPDLIINAAAYTAVDKAESDIDLATKINAEAPLILAQEASALGAALVHFSTDYVFDGALERPYTERDATGPVNIYGKTKRAGEQAITEHAEAYWIFRTSWVYGAHGGNFLKTIIRLAREKEQLSVVADQIGAPTWTRTISQALCACLQSRPSAMPVQDYLRANPGVFHLTAQGKTSWHGYARHVLRQLAALGVDTRLSADAIAAVTTDQYPTAARRPANSQLATDKIRQTFNISLPSWEEALDQCLAEMFATTHVPKT